MADQILTIKPIGSVPRDGVLQRLDMAKPIRSFLATDLLSTRGKLTMLKVVAKTLKVRKRLGYDVIDELVLHDTESVADYSVRELNDELYQYLTGTLVRGAWLANPKQASVAQFFWTAKHFTPHMYSVMGGMSALPTRLLHGVEVRLGADVQNVDERRDKVTVTYQDADGQHSQDFDACVIATPPAPALRMFPQINSAQKTFYENAEYSRSVNVHLGLSRKTDHPDLYVMVPERESVDVTTIFLDHNKAPDRAPRGQKRPSTRTPEFSSQGTPRPSPRSTPHSSAARPPPAESRRSSVPAPDRGERSGYLAVDTMRQIERAPRTDSGHWR